MTKDEQKRIANVAEEAARILRENPELKYMEAIKKAKELVKC